MKVSNRFSFAAVALLLAAPTVSFGQALPKAEDLFAKHVAAVGGKDAIMQVKSLTRTGKLEVAAAGISADQTMWIASNQMAMKVSIPGMGEMQSGFDGKVAWEINPMQGPRVLAGKELDAMKEQSDFQAEALFSPERFTSTQTLEQTTFNNEPAYKVKAVLKSGKEVTYFFSVASGFKIGTVQTIENAMGSQTVTATDSDFKPFGALKFPTRSEQAAGPTKFVMTTTAVTYGDVQPSAFALPDAVKALVKP